MKKMFYFQGCSQIIVETNENFNNKKSQKKIKILFCGVHNKPEIHFFVHVLDVFPAKDLQSRKIDLVGDLGDFSDS